MPRIAGRRWRNSRLHAVCREFPLRYRRALAVLERAAPGAVADYAALRCILRLPSRMGSRTGRQKWSELGVRGAPQSTSYHKLAGHECQSVACELRHEYQGLEAITSSTEPTIANMPLRGGALTGSGDGEECAAARAPAASVIQRAGPSFVGTGRPFLRGWPQSNSPLREVRCAALRARFPCACWSLQFRRG